MSSNQVQPFVDLLKAKAIPEFSLPSWLDPKTISMFLEEPDSDEDSYDESDYDNELSDDYSSDEENEEEEDESDYSSSSSEYETGEDVYDETGEDNGSEYYDSDELSSVPSVDERIIASTKTSKKSKQTKRNDYYSSDDSSNDSREYERSSRKHQASSGLKTGSSHKNKTVKKSDRH